jgi:CheY-like chemotaxis protein
VARHQTVLLIARDGLVRNVTSAGLAMYGYEVLTASNGKEAAQILEANRHTTVLVSDADMPGEIDGLAIARLARAMNPKIDVIYTSRVPQFMSEKEKVTDAPTLRDPYHPHQLVGVISHLRYRPPEPVAQSAA